MSTKFRDFFGEADPGEQGCDFRPETSNGSLLFVNCVPKNLSDLFLHASAMPCGPPLETHLDLFFDISDDKLGHASLRDVVTIS
jgi:hypothetical protein